MHLIQSQNNRKDIRNIYTDNSSVAHTFSYTAHRTFGCVPLWSTLDDPTNSVATNSVPILERFYPSYNQLDPSCTVNSTLYWTIQALAMDDSDP